MTIQEQLEAVGTSKDQSMRHLQLYPATYSLNILYQAIRILF